MRELRPTEVSISGRAGTDYSSLDCPVLNDRFEEAGLLAGIERALEAISSPLLLVLTVDMPRMKLPQLRMLIAQCTENCGGIPRVNNRMEPLAAICPRASLSLAMGLLENQRSAATHFAESCIELKLAVFIDLPEQHFFHFDN